MRTGTLHNKPNILRTNQIASGLTAIIHLEMGIVNRIVWDSSCTLCPESTAEVACLSDRTDVSCVGGMCKDCYAQLREKYATHRLATEHTLPRPDSSKC